MNERENILKKFLENKYGNREEDFWEPEIGTYHASELSDCPKKIYLDKTGEESETDSSSYPYFLLGNMLERQYFYALKSYYGSDHVKNDVRISIELNEDVQKSPIEIVGQTDPVLVDYNLEPKRVFEVKTIKNLHYVEEEPKMGHYMQITPYLKVLKCPGTIVYIKRDDLSTLVHDVSFDPELFSERVEEIKKVHNAIINKTPPPAEPREQWQCKWCDYKEACDEVS